MLSIKSIPLPSSPTLKYIGAAVGVLALTFAAGRYSAPKTVEIQTKTVTQKVAVQDTKTQVATNQDAHLKTETTEIINKDGSKVIKTVATNDTDTKQNVGQDSSSKVTTATTSETKETITKGSSRPINVAIMAGIDFSAPTGVIYGASVSRQFLGPISMGVWGMQNKTGGFSIGLQF